MNKFAIPTILVATVMVAGMFAFMPVEQASTVHTTNTITLAANSVTAAALATDAVTEITDETGVIKAKIIDGAVLADGTVNNIETTVALLTAPAGTTVSGTICIVTSTTASGETIALEVESSTGVFNEVIVASADDILDDCVVFSGLSVEVVLQEDGAAVDDTDITIDATIEWIKTSTTNTSTVTALP